MACSLICLFSPSFSFLGRERGESKLRRTRQHSVHDVWLCELYSHALLAWSTLIIDTSPMFLDLTAFQNPLKISGFLGN